MTMKTLLYAAVLASMTGFMAGCTELKDDLPSPNTAVGVHPQGWLNTASTQFHGNAIRIQNWDMRPCRACHGSAYAGGVAAISCLPCHSGANGPEDCATCHGGTNPAPPRSLSGDTATTASGVGAHQAHIQAGTVASAVSCAECHLVPSAVYANGHIDSNPPMAEVIFQGPLGRTVSNGVIPDPTFRTVNLTCENTYCHGNWRSRKSSAPPGSQFAYLDSIMRGTNASPHWTGGSTEAACGTCHGLPPAGHAPAVISSCGNCHTGIVNTAGDIVDKQKHMNGRINIFGSERDF